MRPKYLKTNYARFGWPLNLEEEGNCWTTNNTTEDFDRIMNFLINEDDNEWQKILKQLRTKGFSLLQSKKFNV